MLEIRAMVPPISLMAATDSCVAPLHAQDVRGYLVGGLRGLARQRFDLGGDHRKTSAGFTGAGGFDGCIERQ